MELIEEELLTFKLFIMGYFKDSDFEQWLETNGDKQSKQSKGYIDSIINNILSNYELDGLFTSLARAIKEKSKTIDKLNDLYSKLNKAATFKKNYPKSNVLAKANGRSADSILQWCSVLKKYIEFLEQNEKESQKYVNWGAKKWNSALVDFWKETISAVAVDGYTSLLNAGAIGSYGSFVKLAIESSYFLNATAVNNHHDCLLDKISKGEKIPARKSTDPKIQYVDGDNLIFKTEDIDYLIEKDPDGNKAVRDLIEGTTGYSVSSGYDCFFTNFKISHIWGHAYDPRMFTSLWNIVIVPAWANDLLDKTNANNDLALKMINTYKAICEKLYAASSKGSKLGLNKNEITPYDPNHVVRCNYNLNIIGNKNNSPIASISKKLVTF